MTIDEAIIRAAESAREESQPFYVYHAGPQHFVHPHVLPTLRWDAVIKSNGAVTLSHQTISEE